MKQKYLSSRFDDFDTAEQMLEECKNVFVYGTLKLGKHNNTVLGTSSFKGVGVTVNKFALGCGGVPFAFPDDKVKEEYKDNICHPIKGDVFEVHSEKVAMDLDSLEGYPSFYYRRVIDVRLTETDVIIPAWIYTIEEFELASSVDACTLTNGVWTWD